MKQFIKLICLLFVYVIANSFIFNKSSFSGSWKLNSEKTDFGILGTRSAYNQLKILQNEKEISIERISSEKTSNGTTIQYNEKIPINGEEVKTIRKFDGKIKKSILEWNSNETFTVKSDYYLPSDTTTLDATWIENWHLSADGKTIEIDCSFNLITIGREGQLKYIYEKEQ